MDRLRIISYFADKCLMVAAMTLSVRGWAENISITPFHMSIEIKNIRSAEKEIGMPVYKKICKNLGRSLSLRSGIWGHGIVKSYTCYRNGKIFSGKKDPPEAGLLLEVEDNPDALAITAYYTVKTGADVYKSKEAIVTLPTSDKSAAILADSEITSLASLMIADGMPVARSVKLPRSNNEIVVSDKTPRRFPLPIPPDEYNIFSLEFSTDRKEWIPRFVGTAKRDISMDARIKESNRIKAKTIKNNPELKVSYDARYVWSVKTEGNDLAEKSGDYWAQDGRGRGQNHERLAAALDKRLEAYGLSRDMLLNSLKDTMVAGYGGFRYGYSFIRGNKLFSKAPMVGIFTELRGGPLEGLRWYWDFAPKTRVKVDDFEYNTTWSRPTLGWSFQVPFVSIPGFKKIDMVPKIGLLDFDATIPVENPEDPGTFYPQTIRLKNALSLGGELGGEIASSWFLLRIWGATDLSFPVVVKSSGSVSSYRGGLDVYWDILKLGHTLEFTLLTFIVGERLKIIRKNEGNGQDEENTGLSLEGLAYNLGYVGLGLTLSW
ncbi:MAG: hypothetical protein HQK54_01975 [Oligoflexales bacterium]|nr:hypothetical protein [Oligoflexales bacterium]